MPVSPARAAAFKILVRVERESAYADELLHSSLLDGLSPADRGLATEIVMGVLRWRSVLDQSIAQFSFTPFCKLDLEVLTALRMGAYQKLFLSKIPSHAVVNETVELVKQSRKTSAAGLANAVMRKIKRGTASDSSDAKDVNGLAGSLAHPKWLVERWVKNFGADTAKLICEYDQRIPRIALRLSAEQDEEVLKQEGIQLEPGTLMRRARIVNGDITTTELFHSGRIAIQDEGSQLVAALVGEGKRVLDCCAAPGGKTGALATRLPGAEIFAAELHPHRARLLRRLVPQPNVHVVTADALALPFACEFDRVLADVPCSGTGTLARNPEIKWKLRPEDLNDLQSRQIAILCAAMEHVSPGGRLVYSTCSLEPEENEQVIAACLKRNSGFKLVPIREELERLRQSGELVWNDIDNLLSGDFLRTIPGMHPCDGFFAAILQKN
ncbi:MAG TPA: 16S rRNA (cytosine(967)-C(5))-methyltransferase RsmB [Candidatus Angelobacter sp.]|nr:16S rRNA (cytosine(967)-C(5))-methyltransferase RsmB [Candidatus Angelobacter sp.]